MVKGTCLISLSKIIWGKKRKVKRNIAPVEERNVGFRYGLQRPLGEQLTQAHRVAEEGSSH